MDLFWKRVIVIWTILSDIETLYKIGYQREAYFIQLNINELHSYDDDYSKMIAWQLVRYANLAKDHVFETQIWDYKTMTENKISLGWKIQ